MMVINEVIKQRSNGKDMELLRVGKDRLKNVNGQREASRGPHDESCVYHYFQITRFGLQKRCFSKNES